MKEKWRKFYKSNVAKAKQQQSHDKSNSSNLVHNNSHDDESVKAVTT